MHGRIASSFLQRLGFRELITSDIDSLKKTATDLIKDRANLVTLAEHIRSKIVADSASISEKTVRGIEKALLQVIAMPPN